MNQTFVNQTNPQNLEGTNNISYNTHTYQLRTFFLLLMAIGMTFFSGAASWLSRCPEKEATRDPAQVFFTPPRQRFPSYCRDNEDGDRPDRIWHCEPPSVLPRLSAYGFRLVSDSQETTEGQEIQIFTWTEGSARKYCQPIWPQVVRRHFRTVGNSPSSMYSASQGIFRKEMRRWQTRNMN